MRIDRLDLIAYGHFSGRSLNFEEGNAGLHLIYGDNEAGKSTSLRALIDWLFGIPTRTPDNFLHSNSQLRIGGRLRLSTGEVFEFIRKKANKGTLLHYGSDETYADEALARFLPFDMDRHLFQSLYGIDHNRLLKGGRELLAESGDLGKALFSAAAGTAGPRQLLTELKKDADELYNPRGKKMLVNQAHKSYQNAQKLIKQKSLSVREWKSWEQSLATTQEVITNIDKELVEKSKAKSRLERFNRIKGALSQRREAHKKLATLDRVYLLPEDFLTESHAAINNLQRMLET